MKKLVLASGSPRREQLLRQLGFDFIVDPSGYAEEIAPGMPGHELARLLSLEKARAAARRHPDAVVIAADTFGIFEDRIIGKPRDAQEAREILAMLSGRWHSVITGFTVMDTESSKCVTESVETLVYLKNLTAAEIGSYVRTGEPLDKAGAYAIQGLGAAVVERTEGDFFNVVGLPLFALCRVLEQFDIRVL
jgi:septum formation protein